MIIGFHDEMNNIYCCSGDNFKTEQNGIERCFNFSL